MHKKRAFNFSSYMRRFDAIGRLRVSQWDNALVAWNPPEEDGTVLPDRNLECKSSVGDFLVEGIGMDGAWIWTDVGDFVADRVRRVKRNGALLYETNCPDLAVMHGLGRWLIRNYADHPVEATILAPGLPEKLSGKLILAGTPPTLETAQGTLRITLPAGEMLMVGLPAALP